MRIACIRSGLLGAATLLAACAGDGVAQSPEPDLLAVVFEDDPEEAPGDPATYLDNLRHASCVDAKRDPDPITLKADPVPLQGLNPTRKTVGELSFVAGFHLTSDEKRFGGLSGLDLLDDGNLLAVSDKGDFVWIDLADDGVTPKSARLSAMKDVKGKPFPSKGEGDAEGLAVTDGLALVSFEGNNRVLAYDVGACGAAARGIPLGWSLTKAFARAKLTVGGNNGVEALAITTDGYLFAGIEMKAGQASPLSARPVERGADFNLRVGKDAPEIVGLDLLPAGDRGQDVRAFSLHRSTSPLASNAITVMETDFERYLDQANLPARVISEADERSHYRFRQTSVRTLAQMNVLLTIDNFEGIAAKELPDGRVRLFIVSDDNFSTSQRTLLMVFDVAKRQ
ncbi:MAG: esterase-like activity of phytase family protein [Hyphomonadaceae bacterium]